METKQKTEGQYTSPAFAICGVCDAEYPVNTTECPKCNSPLSLVRRCPECGRILSAKHKSCLYCKASFLREEGVAPEALASLPIGTTTAADAKKRRRAVLVSVGVFLLVVFLGLYGTVANLRKGGQEVAATSYILSGAPLKLQPNENAGTAKKLEAGTVVSLTGMALGSEGNRWYVLREADVDRFLAVTDVAPPKIRLPELGSQMLRAWLLAFRDPALIPEADSAVNYFCSNFGPSPRCDELRWLAAERFRVMAERGEAPGARDRARELYQAIANGKGPNSAEAVSAIERLDRKPERTAPAAGNRRSRAEGISSYGTGGEYALIDRAEVQVRIPELKSMASGSQLRIPIAREIRINGKVAIPSNATCVLKVLESGNNEFAVQLTAIEFGNKHYSVATEPKMIPPGGGAALVFPLESSLLISK